MFGKIKKLLSELENARKALDNEVAASNKLYKEGCLLYTSPSPRDRTRSRMPSSA